MLHCHHRKTEPRPQVTRKENVVKFEVCFLRMSEQRDRHTDAPTGNDVTVMITDAKMLFKTRPK